MKILKITNNGSVPNPKLSMKSIEAVMLPIPIEAIIAVKDMAQGSNPFVSPSPKILMGCLDLNNFDMVVCINELNLRYMPPVGFAFFEMNGINMISNNKTPIPILKYR